MTSSLASPLSFLAEGQRSTATVHSTTSTIRSYNFCPFDGHPFRQEEANCPLCGTQRLQQPSPPPPPVAGTNTSASTAPSSPLPSPLRARAPWRKLLYIHQDYPDNYVDHTFLEEMQKNVNVRIYDYWTLVTESGVITQHISSIGVFVTVFVRVYADPVSIWVLSALGVVLTVCGYLVWDLRLRPRSNSRIIGSSGGGGGGGGGAKSAEMGHQRARITTVKGAALFSLILLGLSPILKTLTSDTSDDTIWALTTILFLMNLILHDYSSSNSITIKYPGSLATNAAIFASVLLASRLSSHVDVFGLMLFAVEWFALFPILRRSIKHRSSWWYVALTVSMVLLTTLCLSVVSKTVLVMYILGTLFITFACPFWLIWIQRYKNEIHGPWDEARLVLSTEGNANSGSGGANMNNNNMNGNIHLGITPYNM